MIIVVGGGVKVPPPGSVTGLQKVDLFSLDIFQVAVTSPVSCVSGVTTGNGRCGH